MAGAADPASRAGAAPVAATRTAGAPSALVLAFVAVVGYAALDKGFAYAGIPPVFVGEVVLAVVVLSALRSSTALPRNAAALITAGLLAMAAVQFTSDQLAGDAPLLDAVRGAAPIYYALFAFGIYALLRRYEARAGHSEVMATVERAAMWAAPVITAVVLLRLSLLVYQPGALPTWPSSGVQILDSKAAGSVAPLVAVLPLLATRAANGALRRPRLWLLLWLVAALMATFRSRGALLALVLGLIVARPRAQRLVRGLAAVTTVLLVLYVTDVSVRLGSRELSFRSAVASAESLIGAEVDADFETNVAGTRSWRLDWWGDIWSDVTGEPMVLHGHGWGDNLAIRYEARENLDEDNPLVLRTPHSIFFSLAGRAGVVVAVAFLLVAALTLARRAPARLGDSAVVEAARGAIAAGVVTAMTSGHLEGPMGAIPLWCLIGFLWWVTASHGPDDDSREAGLRAHPSSSRGRPGGT